MPDDAVFESAPVTLTVVQAKVAGLHAHERNPRRIRPERLEHLMRTLDAEREMLDARPLIALPDGKVIAGNQRLAAARALGWETIPTVFVELDEVRAATWMFLDNRPFGEGDEDFAGELLAELVAGGGDLDLTGFEHTEAAGLLRRLAQRDRDPDEAPPLPGGEPESKPGELYELGAHRLVCGDARDPERLATLMGGEQAAAVWSDPPYGVEYVGRTRKKLTIENDSPEGLGELLRDVFASVASHVEPGGAFYVAAPAGPMGTVFRQQLDAAGWRFHEALVWVKDVFVLGHSDYHYRHEDMLVRPPTWRGEAGPRTPRRLPLARRQRPDSVFEVARPKRSETHPTMKPVESDSRAARELDPAGRDRARPVCRLRLDSDCGRNTRCARVPGRARPGLLRRHPRPPPGLQRWRVKVWWCARWRPRRAGNATVD